MTLPPLLEFQKLVAEGLRTVGESAVEHPEGFALHVAEAMHNVGLVVTRDEEVAPCLEASDDGRP